MDYDEKVKEILAEEVSTSSFIMPKEIGCMIGEMTKESFENMPIRCVDIHNDITESIKEIAKKYEDRDDCAFANAIALSLAEVFMTFADGDREDAKLWARDVLAKTYVWINWAKFDKD